MMTFILLLIALVVITIIVLMFAGIGGITAIILFGDLIIGGYIIYRIIHHIFKR